RSTRDWSSDVCSSDLEIKIVIGGNTIKALKIATQATMYDHILLVRTLETTYRLHPAPASAHPVSWFPIIDMQRIEAERAVITITDRKSTRLNSSHEWI